MLSNDPRKLKCFEYVTEKLLAWQNETTKSSPNDFSKLKIFKLLFFVSAVGTDETIDGLLNIFNNFHAMPYGPVESDIYNSISKCDRIDVSLNSTKIKVSSPDNYYDSIEADQASIENSVELLKLANPAIINYSAYDLVELSHQWHSWKSTFNLAREQHKLSLLMPISLIKAEPKILKLTENEFA